MVKRLFYKRSFISFMMVIVFILSSIITVSAENKGGGFSDVKDGDSHYEGIMTLSEQGVITGYEDGSFRQWEPLTRQHAAVILYRILNVRTLSNVEDVLDQYDDIDSDSLYANEIAALTSVGIFNGSQGKFMPNVPLTREQMASILTKSFHLTDYEVTEKVDIYLDNVDESHRESVQTLANLHLTNQLDDFRPAESTTRGVFATVLYRVVSFIEEENEDSESAK